MPILHYLVIAELFALVLGAVWLTRSRRVPAVATWTSAALVGCTTGLLLLMSGGAASAAIVPTISLGSASNFSVLAATTVTNTNTSVFNASVGVWAGAAITGVTPAMVNPPGTIEPGTPPAQQAQADLTAAYGTAAGRPLNETATANLMGLSWSAASTRVLPGRRCSSPAS